MWKCLIFEKRQWTSCHFLIDLHVKESKGMSSVWFLSKYNRLLSRGDSDTSPGDNYLHYVMNDSTSVNVMETEWCSGIWGLHNILISLFSLGFGRGGVEQIKNYWSTELLRETCCLTMTSRHLDQEGHLPTGVSPEPFGHPASKTTF